MYLSKCVFYMKKGKVKENLSCIFFLFIFTFGLTLVKVTMILIFRFGGFWKSYEPFEGYYRHFVSDKGYVGK